MLPEVDPDNADDCRDEEHPGQHVDGKLVQQYSHDYERGNYEGKFAEFVIHLYPPDSAATQDSLAN